MAVEAPDSAAVIAFAAQLGIEQPELMWIAEVGIASPLPPRWDAHCDDTGFMYYVNRDIQESTWENPLVPYLKQVVWVATQWQSNPNEEWLNEQISNLWNGFKKELGTWHGPYEEDGKLYYTNSVTEMSSWQDPRVDAQYLFELQCGLLSKVKQAVAVTQRVAETPVFGEDTHYQVSMVGDKTVTPRGEEVPSRDVTGALSKSMIPQNRVPSTAATLPSADEGENAVKSLQELRKKLTEKLAQVDPEQANMEHQKVAHSMRNQLRRVYDFLQNERDSYDIQLQRKRKERQRRMTQHQQSENENRNGRTKRLTIDPSVARVVTRKFKRLAFSGMSLEEIYTATGESPQSPHAFSGMWVMPPK